MLIVGRLEKLPEGFHKYYALYKFFEFVPDLNLGIPKITLLYQLVICYFLSQLIESVNVMTVSECKRNKFQSRL